MVAQNLPLPLLSGESCNLSCGSIVCMLMPKMWHLHMDFRFQGGLLLHLCLTHTILLTQSETAFFFFLDLVSASWLRSSTLPLFVSKRNFTSVSLPGSHFSPLPSLWPPFFSILSNSTGWGGEVKADPPTWVIAGAILASLPSAGAAKPPPASSLSC